MSDAPKFRFSCLKDCSRAEHCCRREIVITLQDLERWGRDNTLMLVFPHLRYELVGGTMPRITIKRGEDGVCPLLLREGNACTIAHARPLNCEAFPLGWSGTAYYIMDRECPGLGTEEMTPAQLEEMRGRAQAEHEARTFSGSVLPVVQAVLMGFFEEQSRIAMDAMTSDEKEKMRKMFTDVAERGAEVAKEKAEEAKEAAEEAKDKAEEAKEAAEMAKDKAEEAKGAAVKEKSKALDETSSSDDE